MRKVPNSDGNFDDQSGISGYENRLKLITIEKEELELKLIDLQVKNEEISSREADQRYTLRGLAIAVIIILIVAMSFLLNAVIFELFKVADLSKIPLHVILIYLAPIISITALAIALLVAAFRGYKDQDVADTANAASKATSMGSSFS